MLLAKNGWWVHFLTPNGRGAQPFDVIALKWEKVLVADCKTCATERFPLSRIEDNQRLAFEAIENKTLYAISGIAVKYAGEVYWLPWSMMKNETAASVKVTDWKKIQEMRWL